MATAAFAAAERPMAPLLVLAWGNRSRGDDALGPLLLDELAARLEPAQRKRVELIETHQLAPELALDLIGRERVLLVDADADAPEPFRLGPVESRRDASLATHALSPQALLAITAEQGGAPLPAVTLLALPARGFELGRGLSPNAAAALPVALAWVVESWIDA